MIMEREKDLALFSVIIYNEEGFETKLEREKTLHCF